QSKQADGRSFGNREAGGLPRIGRFCVRRRGRLPDRRRGHGHFGRGRLSLVAESRGRSCSCSGKGRLAPPDFVTPKNWSAETFLHYGASWKDAKFRRRATGHRGVGRNRKRRVRNRPHGGA